MEEEDNITRQVCIVCSVWNLVKKIVGAHGLNLKS